MKVGCIDMGLSLMWPSGEVMGYTTVCIGEHSDYWTSFTYDVKANFPNIYKNLTRYNFSAVQFEWKGNCTDVPASGAGGLGDFIKYDASTGIFTASYVSHGRPGLFLVNIKYRFYLTY